MNEDIDEQDAYHYDFTTASEWEIFIARLEEVIHQWKLPQLNLGQPLQPGQLRKGEWEKQSEHITFADAEFLITRYHLKQTDHEDVNSPVEEESEEDSRSQTLEDLMSTENDFLTILNSDSEDSGCTPFLLVRWYGLRDFLVLTPCRNQLVSTESKVKMLLSSIFIAINNTYCPVPIFVQVHEATQNFYLGVYEGKGIRSDFEMVHLRRTPSHCKYLTGLLNLFKSKIASPPALEPITVAVRFTYVLRDWTSNAWMQEPPDFEFLQGESVGVAELGHLPFGVTFDPISELQLYATWPQLVENSVVDSESYSDFEPSQAPLWSVGLTMADQPACLLSEYFNEFIQLCSSKRTMQDLLGDLINKDESNLSLSLNALTESRVPTISKVLKKAKGHRQEAKPKSQEGPIAEDLLMPILYFLFPDADDNPKYPYPESCNNTSVGGSGDTLENELSGLKTTPVDSLIWRLAVVMSHVVHTLGGVKAAAHLWYEFTQEMRFRWERCINVPGVSGCFPDPRTCLLLQKLQMLNCCVTRKTSREKQFQEGSMEVDETESESDEEFFDCSDEERSGEEEGDQKEGDEQEEGEGEGERPLKKKNKHSLWNQPVGRMRKHGNLRLVNTGEHLYIPFTQEPTPKTEDQVEEDAEVLLMLGTDAHGSELRARMMSASLLSDMESFKAANPGALLDDFIRWYSPRDWIELEGTDQYGQRNGVLSARMQIKGNTWAEVWQAAKPVPARRQKRLFDDTREAEKVLHFLDTQQPAGMARLLLPVLTHAALYRVKAEKREELPLITARITSMTKNAERLTRSPGLNLKKYEELAQDLVNVEATIAQANSLKLKFADPGHSMESADLDKFLLDLMQSPEVMVPAGPRGHVGSRIQAMFSEAQKALQMITDVEPIGSQEETWTLNSSTFPRPSSREFIMRVTASRPTAHSAAAPQRMYASLKKEEFRLAGCFSQDTSFL